MTKPNNSSKVDIDSEFKKKFRALKQKRNNHLIDEPEFDDAVEQLAANTYAHDTRDGWCCACEADIAFALSSIKEEPEYQTLITSEIIAELERLSMAVIEPCEPECNEVRHARHEGSWNAHLKIEDRIKHYKGKGAK